MEFEFNPDTLYNMDCLEGMKLMPDKCVDVSFTSPPYNDKGHSDTVSDTGKFKSHTDHHTKYKWNDFREDWYQWQCDVIDEMLRVSKKYVLYNVQGIKNSRHDIYKIIGKYADRIHDILIWHKPAGQPCSNPHKISNRYEFVLILRCDGVHGVDVNSNFYTNVIYLNGNTNRDFSKIHRAVMAKNFCDEIIKEFTKPGDIVLDPFFGLGTTGVSCIEQGRHYVGFEIFEEYFNIANDRLNDAKVRMNSTLW